jgi:hypothetical protein
VDTQRAAFEQHAQALCGQRIAKVRYFEINYEDGQLGWNYYGNRFDTLDFGLELEMESGELFDVIWDKEFVQYNLSLRNGSLREEFLNGIVAVRDVTTEPNWRRLQHQPISEVRVYWSRQEVDGVRTFYPQTIEITFAEADKVYLSAASYRPSRDELWSVSDDVLVIFRDEVAQRYHVGPYAVATER